MEESFCGLIVLMTFYLDDVMFVHCVIDVYSEMQKRLHLFSWEESPMSRKLLMYSVVEMVVWGVMIKSVFDAGNGEQGKPFPLTDADRVDQAYRENGFNIYVSRE